MSPVQQDLAKLSTLCNHELTPAVGRVVKDLVRSALRGRVASLVTSAKSLRHLVLPGAHSGSIELHVKRDDRNTAIRDLASQGANTSEIAVTLGLSKGAVRQRRWRMRHSASPFTGPGPQA